MISLPLDLQNETLDFITDPITLASLCLVCKAFSALVTPRLYTQITASVADCEDVITLQSSIGAGAGHKFQLYTRSLTFLDERPPRAIPSHPVDFEYLPPEFPRVPGASRLSHSERDLFMYLVLVLIPDKRLRTFRFLSDRPLGMRVVEHLFHYQTRLEQFQGVVEQDPYFQTRFSRTQLCQLPNQFADLNTLDILFTSLDRFEEFTNNLAWTTTTKKPLQNLRLSISSALKASEVFETAISQRHPGHHTRLANIRNLTLDGFDLGNMFSQIDLIINLRSITDLTLWNCPHADSFLLEMANTYRTQSLALENLAVCLNGTFPDNVDSSLGELFFCCSLRALHLTWNVIAGYPRTTLATIAHLGPSLRSLSFHNSCMDNEEECERGSHLGPNFGQCLDACSQLQQFGIQVSGFVLNPGVWEKGRKWGKNFPSVTFWHELKYLPNLTILHLRQGDVMRYDTEEIAWRMERFASGLFQFLDQNHYCPNFKTLVIGTHRPSMLTLVSTHSLRHCFIKGHQQAAFDRYISIAIPVSARVLREERPVSNILDFDPGCEWFGGRPGQFRCFR